MRASGVMTQVMRVISSAFRAVCPDPDQYTWWSFRGQARAKNVGWRIDYQITTPDLADKIRDAKIFPTPLYSDHAPLLIGYDLVIQ